jgi:hypothetical protein
MIAFPFSQATHDSNNHGKCYWENGYFPNNHFECTRELAACSIAGYFAKDNSRLEETNKNLRAACDTTRTGRRLVVPLFVASVLMFGCSIGKLLVERKKKHGLSSETANERVIRLQNQ